MYVYLLRSVAFPDRTYVGLTADLKARLADHNAGHTTHTRKYAPWTIAVAIYFADEAKARAFERYLKHGSGHAFARRHFL